MILLLWWGAYEKGAADALIRLGPLRFANVVALGWLVEYRDHKAITINPSNWQEAYVGASIRGNDVRYESQESLVGYIETIRVRDAAQRALEQTLTGAALELWKQKRVRSLKFHESRVLSSSTRQAPSPFRQQVVMLELSLIAEKLAALGV